jgi:hypothetical protein
MLGDSISCDNIPPKHVDDHYYHKHLIFATLFRHNIVLTITLLPNLRLPFFGCDDDGLSGPEADLVRALSREIEQGSSQEVILFALIYIKL